MSKYTVLMVDDEENVIRAMQKKIDWESIGFRIMGYAHNGIEALDLAEQEAPDVVLTDIKMPYMDGLELAHNLKIMYPTVRILIFSGFDEFEYAKEAIRLEVEEYILKPVDADELRRIFMRIKESLDQEMDEKRNVQKLRDYYMESLPLLQENFYSSLVDGGIPEAEIPRYLADYQINLDSPMYTAVVIHTSTTQRPEGISAVLLTESVRRLAAEHLKQKWNTRMFSHDGNTVVLVPCRSQELRGSPMRRKTSAVWPDMCARLWSRSESGRPAGHCRNFRSPIRAPGRQYHTVPCTAPARRSISRRSRRVKSALPTIRRRSFTSSSRRSRWAPRRQSAHRRKPAWRRCPREACL